MTENKEYCIDEITCNEIKANWNELIIPHTIKENLDMSIISPTKTIGKPRDYGVILFGLPGVGKTTIPFAIAKKLGWKLFYISPKNFVGRDKNPEYAMKQIFEDIRSKYKKISVAVKKYEKAKKMGRPLKSEPKPAKMVFVFDEMDEFVASRSSESDKDSRFLTTMMLPLFNDLREDAEKYNFIFFALTNHISRFDTAITRKGRFDLVLPLGLPNRTGRFLWFEAQLEKLTKDYAKQGLAIVKEHEEPDFREKDSKKSIIVEDVDLDTLSRASDGLSFGDIESVCKRVIESEIYKENIQEFLKLKLVKRQKIPMTIRISTEFFLSWMNRLRQSSRINDKDTKKFFEDIITYTRGSSDIELDYLVSEAIEEFDSVDVKADMKINGSKCIFNVKIRNLSEYSTFSYVNAKVFIKIGNNNPILEPLNFSRKYVLAGQSTDSIEFDFHRPKNGTRVVLEYHIEDSSFELRGVSGTLGNSSALVSNIIKTKEIVFD